MPDILGVDVLWNYSCEYSRAAKKMGKWTNNVVHKTSLIHTEGCDNFEHIFETGLNFFQTIFQKHAPDIDIYDKNNLIDRVSSGAIHMIDCDKNLITSVHNIPYE